MKFLVDLHHIISVKLVSESIKINSNMNGPRSRSRIQFIGHRSSHARNLADFIAAKPEHCNFGFEQVSVSVWLIETLDLSRILNFLPSHCN